MRSHPYPAPTHLDHPLHTLQCEGEEDCWPDFSTETPDSLDWGPAAAPAPALAAAPAAAEAPPAKLLPSEAPPAEQLLPGVGRPGGSLGPGGYGGRP
jgi:hypothetical protein